MRVYVLTALAALAAAPLCADYSYRQTSQMTGGAFLKVLKMMPGGGKATQPMVTRMSIKGNRMMTEEADGFQIIDLDKETMTDVNLKERSYSVITFAEMKAAMEAMVKKMGQQSKGSQNTSANVEMKMEVKETGVTKQVSGLDTREFLLLIGWTVTDAKSGQTADMKMDNQMWMAADLPGYDEVRKFQMRMAEKIQVAPGNAASAMGAMQPNMREGMAKLMKESQKLKGVPVQQITKMKMAGQNGGEMPDLPEFQLPGMREAMADEAGRSAGSEAANQSAQAAGGRFGGLAGSAAGSALGGLMRGRAKKQAEEPKPAQQAKEQKKGDGTYMEITTITSDWSAEPIDGAKFNVPAGFKQVEHPMKKQLR